MSGGAPGRLTDAMHAAIGVLRDACGVDLSDYHPSTLERRLAWRLGQLGDPPAERYLELLRADRGEREQLLNTLLVPVTSFFRDPEAFEALRASVLPVLVERSRGMVRVWAAGVASGEEAWTLAMLLTEECERQGGADFQLTATDVQPALLRAAASGRYPREALLSIPPALRARFLTEGDPGLIRESLRERVRFVPHDLVGTTLAPEGAVVASFDLVVCRNVLIYLGARLQEIVLQRFAAVTEPGGVLMLGPAEALHGPARHAFTPHPHIPPRSHLFLRLPRGP